MTSPHLPLRSHAPRTTPARLYDISVEMETLRIGEPSSSATTTALVGRALGSDAATVYRVGMTAAGLDLDWIVEEGFPYDHSHVEATVRAHFRKRPPVYDPVSPAPRERNRVFNAAGIAALHNISMAELRERGSVIGELGMDRLDQLRALVCDDASLLAWVGGLQEEPFRDDQVRTLEVLLPSIQRRLLAERRLANAPMCEAALAAALEGIGAPAYILSSQRRILSANSAGRELLLVDRRSVAAAIADVVARRPAALLLDVIPLTGKADGYLAIVRSETKGLELAQRAAAAASRWQLTAMQARVLAFVAKGAANRTIADSLRIAERTVQYHVTKIFERAGVGSRAALVSEVLRG